MPFPPGVREEALIRSRRCCSICHEFAGLYTDVHHIVQEADGGPNTLENAIPLCDRCHGEVGHYNPRHAKGTKYRESELKRHRDEWWDYIATNPAAALPVGPVSVGPTRIDFPTSAIESMRYELHINNSSDLPCATWGS
jgi:hypothetical protein